jgi:hypothetical protein
MTSQLTVTAVERREDHYDGRFRDDDELDDVGTPGWAQDLADSAVSDSEVRMGRDDTDEWLVHSVRVPAAAVDSDDDASRKALQVVTVVSEHDAPDSN